MDERVVKYLSIRIGTQWYGVKVDKVIEVLQLVAYTEAPTTDQNLLGLITVRDVVMPLIDLRRYFRQPSSLRLDTPIIAIREQDGPMAMICDDVDRVEEIEMAQVVSAQDSRQFPSIQSIAKLPGRLMLILDTERIFRELQRPDLDYRPERINGSNGHANGHSNGHSLS